MKKKRPLPKPAKRKVKKKNQRISRIKKPSSHKLFIRFIFVGIMNSIFGYGIYAFFTYLGLDVELAMLLATILGIAFNFKTTGVLVFKSHDNKLILRFFGVYLIVYLFNIMGIKTIAHIGFNSYISGAIMIVPSAILAFLLNKRFVF